MAEEQVVKTEAKVVAVASPSPLPPVVAAPVVAKVSFTNPATGAVEQYTPTNNPNVAVDAGGNNVYVGGYVRGGYTPPVTNTVERNAPVPANPVPVTPLNVSLAQQIANNMAQEGLGTGQIILPGQSGEQVLAQQQAQAIQQAQIQYGISPTVFAKGSATTPVVQQPGAVYVKTDSGLMVAKDALAQLPDSAQAALGKVTAKNTYVLTAQEGDKQFVAQKEFGKLSAEQQQQLMVKDTVAGQVPTIKTGVQPQLPQVLEKPLTVAEQQELQRNAGVAYIKSDTGEFVKGTGTTDKTYVVTGKGEMILQSSIDGIKEDRYKTILIQNGLDAYKKTLAMEYVSIPAGDGKYQLIKNTNFFSLPQSQQYVLLHEGFSGLDKFIAQEEKALSGYAYQNKDGTSNIDILLALRAGGERESQAVNNLYTQKQIDDAVGDNLIKANNPNPFLWMFETAGIAGEVIANPVAVQQTSAKIREFFTDLPKTIIEAAPQLKGVKDYTDSLQQNTKETIDIWNKENPEQAKAISNTSKVATEALKNVAKFGEEIGVWSGYIEEIIKTSFVESAGALGALATGNKVVDTAIQVGSHTVGFGGGIVTGALSLIAGVPAMLIGTAITVGSDVALQAVADGKTAKEASQQGVEKVAGLVLGLGSFMATTPMAVTGKNWEWELPYRATMILSPEKLLKVAEMTKTIISPKAMTWEGLSFDIDVGRPAPARGQSPYALVEGIGKSIREIAAQANEAIPEMLRTGHDVIINDPVTGKVVAHVSGIERAGRGDVIFSSNPTKFEITKDILNQKGEYDVKYLASEMIRNKTPGWEKAFGMDFNSPQPAATFLADAYMATKTEGSPVIKAKIYSPADFRDVPEAVKTLLFDGKLDEAKQLLADMNREGKLEPALYDCNKWYRGGTGPRAEFEIVDTLKYKPIPDVPFWAKDKTSNTAITYVDSPMRSFSLSDIQRAEVFSKFEKKFGIELTVDAKTGNFKVESTTKPNYSGQLEFSPEQAAKKVGMKIDPQLSVGQKIPVVWMISENAIAEGKGMPSLATMYKAKAYGLLGELRKGIPFVGLKEIRQETTDVASGQTTDKSFKSVAPITTESPAWAKGTREQIIANANALVADGKLEVFRRPRATAIIVDQKTGKIFLTSSKGEKPGFTGGGIDKGEKPVEGLVREMGEEVGLKPTKVEKIGTFDDPNPIISDKTGDPVFNGGKLMYDKHSAYLVLVDDVSKAKVMDDVISKEVLTIDNAKKLGEKGKLMPYADLILEGITADKIKEFISGKEKEVTGKAKGKAQGKELTTDKVTGKNLEPDGLTKEISKIKEGEKPVEEGITNKELKKSLENPADQVKRLISKPTLAEHIYNPPVYHGISMKPMNMPLEKYLDQQIAAEKVASDKAVALNKVALAEKTPVEKTPSEKVPVEKMPVEKMPTEKIPTETTPTETTPVETTPVERVPTEKVPVEKVPTEKTPNEKVPTEKTPTEKTPAETVPGEKTPAEKTPTERTPGESTPSEKTPTETTPHETIPHKPPPTTNISPAVSEKFAALTPEQLEGAVAWKQGWNYRMRYPPYGQEDEINSRSPLAGVQYHDGPHSAYESLVVSGGDIPRDLLWTMGIVTTGIDKTPLGTKPQLRYVQTDLAYGEQSDIGANAQTDTQTEQTEGSLVAQTEGQTEVQTGQTGTQSVGVGKGNRQTVRVELGADRAVGTVTGRTGSKGAQVRYKVGTGNSKPALGKVQ